MKRPWCSWWRETQLILRVIPELEDARKRLVGLKSF